MLSVELSPFSSNREAEIEKWKAACSSSFMAHTLIGSLPVPCTVSVTVNPEVKCTPSGISRLGFGCCLCPSRRVGVWMVNAYNIIHHRSYCLMSLLFYSNILKFLCDPCHGFPIITRTSVSYPSTLEVLSVYQSITDVSVEVL